MTRQASGREQDAGELDELISVPAGAHLSAAAQSLIQTISRMPRTASYASAGELAQQANISTAAITRAAQALGFTGWPALQQEIRQRYLSSLSTLELASAHSGAGSSPAAASLRQDRDNMSVALKRFNTAALTGIARAISSAGRVIVVASGSYVGVAHVLAHNARLCGYEVVLASEGPSLTNELSRLRAGDTLVALSFWRPYAATVKAAEFAQRAGATVCVITDSRTGIMASLGGELTLVVPTEGVSHFPSLTSAMSMAHALCAEIAAIDPRRTRESVAAFEKSRDAFGLLSKERIVETPPPS